MSKIVENIENVERNIENACKRGKRERNEVTLIAVSKTKPVDDLKVAYDAGIRDFGENKVQEILDKYDKLPKDINWHMIGHLQTNKVKYIIDKVCMIHSVDSLKLAEEISKRALAAGVVMPILIEINIGDEESKFGITFDTAVDFLSEIVNLPGIKVKGFMCIAPYTENAEENRIYFKKLKQLYVDITTKNIDNRIVGIDDISILSMGMTGDYEVAVEEGATHIRVGTGIFGARDYTV
ncbi:MAG: YggS family pyridoxal phosphate-dependent enzyme [Lachnospiraceae bacterium]|nr:YggS family pyridoxal phosphate-dependent enzyme [Lachnospiraceae bacterium]